MSKTWKIVWAVLVVLVALGALGIGALVYFGGQFVNGMQTVAKDIYGGPLPSHVVSVMGLDLKTSKVAVFTEKDHRIAMVVVTSPPAKEGKQPLSNSDVKGSIASMGNSTTMKQSLQGVDTGEEETLKLGNNKINTLKYRDKNGKFNELGVLNLDKNQLLFIGISENDDQMSENIANFLMEMPVLKNDSHFTSQTDGKTAQAG